MFFPSWRWQFRMCILVNTEQSSRWQRNIKATNRYGVKSARVRLAAAYLSRRADKILAEKKTPGANRSAARTEKTEKFLQLSFFASDSRRLYLYIFIINICAHMCTRTHDVARKYSNGFQGLYAAYANRLCPRSFEYSYYYESFNFSRENVFEIRFLWGKHSEAVNFKRLRFLFKLFVTVFR